MSEKDVLKTGTTTMGVVCKDCVVLAADKRATAGYMVVDKSVQKVIKLNDRFALTIAGSVSDAQLFIKVIKAQIALKEVQTNRNITVKETANLISSIVYSSIRTPSMLPSVTHFLLAGVDKNIELYDIFPDGSITKINDFVSSGSGSPYTIGVLESAYSKDMKEEDGVNLVKKAIDASLKRDAMTGNGFDIAVINKEGVKFIETYKINTGLY